MSGEEDSRRSKGKEEEQRMNERRIKKARKVIRNQETAMLEDMRKVRHIPFLIRIAEVNGWNGFYMRWAARWELRAIRLIMSARKRATHNVARTHRGSKKIA